MRFQRLIALTLAAALIGAGHGDDRSSGTGASTDGRTGGGAVRGVTDTTIKIGLLSFNVGDAEEAGEVVGGGSADGSDASPDGIVEAVVNHINENGGIAGRQIEPVYFFFDAEQYATAAGRQLEQQRACAAWTEDNEVFAFVGSSMSEDVIYECAASTGTVMIATGPQLAISQSQLEDMGGVWYSPHGFVADRREATLAEGLLTAGLLPDDARVGVVIEDRPSIREGVESGLLPALEDAGISPVVEVVYPDFIESPWSTYILQMKEAGVTHILMSTTAGDLWSTSNMMKAAEEQDYYPQWGIGSDNGPHNLKLIDAPVSQLENTAVVGWRPANDVGSPDPISEADEFCRELMVGAGQPAQAGDGICDALFFLQAALEAADEISPAGMAAGLDALGSDFTSAMTIDGQTEFSVGRHDGVSHIQILEYDEGCPEEGAACFRYVGEPIGLSTQ